MIEDNLTFVMVIAAFSYLSDYLLIKLDIVLQFSRTIQILTKWVNGYELVYKSFHLLSLKYSL